MTSSLKHRGFAIWSVCQFIAYLGRWVQAIGLNWLAYKQTHDAVTLALLTGATLGPILLLSPFAGSLADRFDGKRILGATQTLMLVQSLALASLYFFGHPTFGALWALALMQGTLNALDAPARQLFYRRILPDLCALPSALSVTLLSFNVSRLLGPALGGIVAGQLGEGWCFGLAAATCLPLQLVALRLKLQPAESRKTTKGAWAAVRYVQNHGVLLRTLSLAIGANLLLLPFIPLLPAFTREALNGGVSMVGLLSGFEGAGAVAAALFQGWLVARFAAGHRVMGAYCTVAVGLVGLAMAPGVGVCAMALVVLGFSAAVALTATQELLQTQSSSEMRGKVLGLSMTASYGMLPLGSLLVSEMAGAHGIRLAFATTASLFLAAVALAGLWHRKAARRSAAASA